MFQIKHQHIGETTRHAVVGEVGSQVVTILATSEVQACEIARCLNEAAGIEVEDLVEQIDVTELHQAFEDIMARQSMPAPEVPVTAEEDAAWRDFDARR